MPEVEPRSGEEPVSEESPQPAPRPLLDALYVIALTLIGFELREWRIGLPATQYFDEVYYVKAAKDYLAHNLDSNTVHPPLGKILIACFLWLYQHLAQPLWQHGFLDLYTESAGWRMGDLIFGTMMIPMTWWLGRRVFRSRFVANVSAFLLTIDWLHLVQSRIAMLDMFLAWFILVAAMTTWLYIEEENPRRSLAWIAITALMLGFGTACKWNALWAGIGCWLCMVLLKPTDKQKSFGMVMRGGGIAATFAVVIPICYLITFIPFFCWGGSFKMMYDNHHTMVTFRYSKEFTHRYMSPMWDWPTDLRPVWYFYEEHDTGDYSMFPKNTDSFLGRAGWHHQQPGNYVYGVIALGSWFVWWFFLLFFALTVIQCIVIPLATLQKPEEGSRRTSRSWLEGFDEWRFGPNRPWLYLIFMYVPQLGMWAIMHNPGFLFYVLPCVPFMCILISAILEEWQDLSGGKLCIGIFLFLALALFVVYYPLLTDYPIPQPLYKQLIFRDGWI
jgi:dolichyl-phosphate-mannose--protein O-mannosyl transferase